MFDSVTQSENQLWHQKDFTCTKYNANDPAWHDADAPTVRGESRENDFMI